MAPEPWSLEALQAHQAAYAGQPDKQIYIYHAHTYFDHNDAKEVEQANDFRRQMEVKFGSSKHIKVSEMDMKAGGPHPCGQFEFAFTREVLIDTLPWLQLNRPHNLSMLLHPFTILVADDHMASSTWLGSPVDLNVNLLISIQKRFVQRVAAGEDEAKIMWAIIDS